MLLCIFVLCAEAFSKNLRENSIVKRQVDDDETTTTKPVIKRKKNLKYELYFSINLLHKDVVLQTHLEKEVRKMEVILGNYLKLNLVRCRRRRRTTTMSTTAGLPFGIVPVMAPINFVRSQNSTTSTTLKPLVNATTSKFNTISTSTTSKLLLVSTSTTISSTSASIIPKTAPILNATTTKAAASFITAISAVNKSVVAPIFKRF
jgi:hypothetical protein